jgi:hypothetical protein
MAHHFVIAVWRIKKAESLRGRLAGLLGHNGIALDVDRHG